MDHRACPEPGRRPRLQRPGCWATTYGHRMSGLHVIAFCRSRLQRDGLSEDVTITLAE